MLKNIAWAVLDFLTRMLILLAIVAVSPIALPILSYYQLRAQEYSRTVSIMLSLAVFAVVSSLYFLAVIVPIFMPNLAIATSIINLSQSLLILCPRILQVLAVMLVHFFPPSPPPSALDSPGYEYINRAFRSPVPVYEQTIGPQADRIERMIQELAITKESRNVLSDRELALIKTLLVAKTATDPQKQTRELLRSLSERYVALKEKIDAVQQSLIAGTVLEDFDELCACCDVDIPILCVKEYQKDGAWLAVPNMSYITDRKFIIDWGNEKMTHPLNRDSFSNPPSYVDSGASYPARYSFYQLTKEHCWAAELDESALKIRGLIKQLEPQATPSVPHNPTATGNSFFSRFFGRAATATANTPDSTFDSSYKP